MRVLIIEDEAMAANRLERLLHEIAPHLEVVAKLDSVRESIKWLSMNSADLLFLDIQLSDGISFSIFEEVVVHTPVIFTTAYDQYAIRAFRLNSIAYLLKPVQKEELAIALQKFASLKLAVSIPFDQLLSLVQGAKQAYRKRFLIQIASRFRKIEVSEIAYFYAMEKSVFLSLFTGQSYPIDHSLDTLAQELDPARFFRINRRLIVSVDSISGMVAWSRSRLKLQLTPPFADDSDTVVSIERSRDFKVWLNR